MMQKFFIITTDPNNSDKYKLAEYLSGKYDLDIAYSFTTDDDISNYKVQYSIDEIVLAYRNNALLSCLSDTKNNIHQGITMDEFYNKNLFCMSMKEFANISESLLCNCIIIWLDQNKDLVEYEHVLDSRNFIQLLDNVSYMYFNEDLDTVKEIVSEYIEADYNRKLEIIDENL